jgi:hypothetical protein
MNYRDTGVICRMDIVDDQHDGTVASSSGYRFEKRISDS